MRVLIVISSLQRGGAERVAATLSRELAASHETHILVFDATNIAYDFGGTLIDLGLKPVSGLVKLLNVFRRARAIRKDMMTFRPHLTISFMESANFPVAIAAAFSGSWKRTYVSVRNNPGMFPWHIRLVGAILYRIPAGVVACSAGVADAITGAFRIRRQRIRTIVNPVDVQCHGGAGQTWHLPLRATERPYFVAVGRLQRIKGFDVLLDAWSRSGLATSHNLVVLGDGPLRDELRQMAESLGLGASLHFLGAVANPFPIVRQAEAFVLSSRFEGWPNALAEAMALGVPVISTDCNFGPSELIRNADEGILVPVDDPHAMARAMRTLSEDETLRRRLAAAAQARTAELAPQRIVDQWLALVDGDLAGTAGPTSTSPKSQSRNQARAKAA